MPPCGTCRAPAGTLDIERAGELLAWLRAAGRIGCDEEPAVRVLAGGVSNRTVLVERAGGSWVLKQALPKLRVPIDWFSDPLRVHREAAALRVLAELAPGSSPALLWEDETEHVICMEAVAEPHENWKEKLLAGRVDRREAAAFGSLLARIHGGSAPRLGELAALGFADRSFFTSLRLEPYYGYAAQQVPAAAPFLRELAATTLERADALVHGDYSPKNVLVRAGRLVLLDHEVAHLGDPGFDLGFALAHLLSKAHHLPAAREALAGAAVAFAAAYDEAVASEERSVRHALGCLLARVAGRSRLEYLDDAARERQERAVLRLLPAPPASVAALAERFLEALA